LWSRNPVLAEIFGAKANVSAPAQGSAPPALISRSVAATDVITGPGGAANIASELERTRVRCFDVWAEVQTSAPGDSNRAELQRRLQDAKAAYNELAQINSRSQMQRAANPSNQPVSHAFRDSIRALAVSSVRLLASEANPTQQGCPNAVLSEQQIEEAPHPLTTRSFTPRGLTRCDASPQSVSLNIQFEHNLSALQPEATAQRNQLLSALTSPSLRKNRFPVAGHTEAKGARRKRLSLRRAEGVKEFLVAGGMDAQRLDTVGFGSERILDPDRPEDARIRRVEDRDFSGSAP